MKIKDLLEATQSAALFTGRFQPLHLGHVKIINDALKKYDHVVVCIVRGEESSKDKDRNPFSFRQQLDMFKRVFGDKIHVIQSDSGFIPGIISRVDDKLHIQINTILAGSDRVNGYKAQCKDMNLKFVTTPRLASGTEVREAIKDRDKKKFKSLMPSVLHGVYDEVH
jgi:cytidyltransferase-like protein